MKKSAFSLIELAIVLAIAGIIVGGITKGASLIRGAKLINARSITSKSVVAKTEGLVVWYEPSLRNSFKTSETSNQAQLTAWYDVAPLSIADKKNSLTRSASADVVFQEAAINDIPAAKFSNSANFSLANFYQGSSAQATIFTVFQPLFSPDNSAKILIDSSSANATNSVGIKNNAVVFDAGSSADTGTSTNAANFALGKNYIAAIYFNRASSAAYVNDATTLIGNGNVNPGTNSLAGLTIGSDKSGSNGFSGYISEIIIFNRPLKLQERKDIMSYLAKKYRITVSNL